MKKILLSAIVLFTSAIALYAQPTLTAATNNPVPGDAFLGYQLDPTGTTPGAAGGPVTWSFTTLPVTGMDTTTYLACASTPYCDSFPGSNIVMFDNTDYYYENASSALFSYLGIVAPPIFIYTTGTYGILYYPLTYNSTFNDTFSASFSFFGTAFYHHEVDSMVYDAYGTITLPSGTYTNAVRVHVFSVSIDTSTGMGADTGLIETYSWYIAGFHNPIFTYTVDTADGNSAEYYINPITLSTNLTKQETLNLQVFPNPAADAINLKFNLYDNSSASATLSDITGRVIYTFGNDKINNGANEITFPVNDLPNGMYLIRLQTAEGNITKKVIVSR